MLKLSKDNIPEKIAVKDFRTLLVYQKSMELSREVYKVVKQLPDIEKYAMANQMIRAVTSISSNLAEGQSTLYGKKEMTFISNALGSAGEMKCWYEHCLNLGYMSKDTFDMLDLDTSEIIKMLIGYAKKLKIELSI